jgi:uncharacterized membrane protein YjgN (DUF898 family)
MEEKRETAYLPFSFEGSGKEYFRIWIVNIALTILTLGIYSAWAKVRTNRYFYANTYLNGSNFEYNADPKRILMGRIIVFGGYAVFILFFHYLGMLDVAGMIAMVGFFAIPWLIRQAVSFKLRNTSYRNVPFRYTGKTWDFYKFFLLNGLLFIVVAGIAAFIPLINMIVIFFLVGYIYVKFKSLIVNHSYYGDGAFSFFGDSSEVYGIYMKITGWMFLLMFLGLLGVVVLDKVFSEIIGELLEAVPLLMSLFPVVAVVAYLSIIFFQKGLSDAYHSNFVRNNTILNQASLQGEMNPLKLAWISVTNVLALVFSLGLLHPWAKVRYMRYKLEHTYFRCEDYGQFESHGFVQGSTIGEETVDFFDIDIGL